MAKPPRLPRGASVDLPIVEASGVATRWTGTETRVLVVGDRTAEIAGATYADGQLKDWWVLDLVTLSGWPKSHGDSQFEAIACDAGSVVAVMREDPPEILVINTDSRSVVSRIDLVVPKGSALDGKWDDPSSRGEGMLLLRGGRVLVVKEKRPRALVEFGPAGTKPRGLSADDFLDPGEAWDPPSGEVTYEALTVWKLGGSAKEALGDISDIGVGRDHSLWLLSDKSRAVARLGMPGPLPAGKIKKLDDVYRLPKKTVKPEGICALDGEHVLVAFDTKKKHDNGMVLTASRAN